MGAPKRRRLPETWTKWPGKKLLGIRLCDLPLTVEGTWLEDQIDRVRGELDGIDLRLRPHFWLADEWFCPDGVPGVAIPFYLAHPRLVRLERQQMFEVEGGSPKECAMLLRHELGHAAQHAWQLHRRKRWRQLFGSASKAYPESYQPNPASKRFVQHLDAWYAQSHPVEDFAETFAVWLNPKAAWRRRYARWPARKKLEYVDELMGELAGRPRRVNSRARPYQVRALTMTLREYYAKKKAHYTVGHTEAHDADLRRLFEGRRRAGQESAATFLRRHRREIRELVSNWTGDYMFTVDQILNEMTGRCRELKLVAVGNKTRLKLDFAILLTVHSMNYLYRGRYWHPM